MNINQDQLIIFITVMETGSFSAAARQLGKVPSAISMSIANLEIDLNLNLFERIGREPTPTPAAMVLYEKTQQLLIESEVIIQHYNESPLDFIVSDYAINYPFKYLANDNFILSSYMVLPNEETRTLLNNWIYNIYKYNEKIQTYTLLQKLTTFIFKNFTYKVREEAGVQTAKQTLSYASGSCRDFAFLFMEAVKCLGLATRFVSGYLYAPLMSEQVGSTHAWAEVYIPGGGWIGFDPTTGNIAGDRKSVV